MRRFLKYFAVFIGCAGIAIYFSWNAIQAQFVPFVGGIAREVHTAYSPCTEPITYDIGTFDTQFGISKEDFLSAIADARAIWEKPFNRQFFAYAPGTGDLKINLVYDYRQQAADKLNSLGLSVKDTQASYDSLKAKYTALETQYGQASSTFYVSVQSYNTEKSAYDAEVAHWNQQGGAPQAQYQQLESERVKLQSESDALQSAQDELNSMVSEINALVVVLNRLGDSLNLSVQTYNTTGSSLGESFEEGLYQSSDGNQKIDIYEFTDRAKLVRVLAHELGHALGLGHVLDPNAIMYAYNQSTSTVLTADDIAAVDAVCHFK